MARQENGTDKTDRDGDTISVREMCFRAAIPDERKNGVAEFYGSETPYGRMEAEDEEGKSRHVRDTWHGRREVKREREGTPPSPGSRVPIFS